MHRSLLPALLMGLFILLLSSSSSAQYLTEEAQAYFDAGVASAYKGNDEAKAEQQLLRALHCQERQKGHNNYGVVTILLQLADVRKAQKKYDIAEADMLRALSISLNIAGPDSINHVFPLNALYHLYFDQAFDPIHQVFAPNSQALYAKAEKVAKREIDLFEKALGKDDIQIANELGLLTGIYKLQKRYAECEQLYTRRYAIYEKAKSDNSSFAFMLVDRSHFFITQKRYVEAENDANRAFTLIRPYRI